MVPNLSLCTFGWCLICLLQICFSWNGSQQGGIQSGVYLFVWPQMDRNTRLLWLVVISRSTPCSTTHCGMIGITKHNKNDIHKVINNY
uniref:Secreted protein n=1 Tax=Lepeophtheirus salmonis TaxID=72036 RepID=A0A0K2SZF6_LEPSM